MMRPLLVVVAALLLVVTYLLTMDEWVLRTLTQTEGNPKQLSETSNTSSCVEYCRYPFPKHHSGLPYLGDVFASHNADFVNFIAINRGSCRHEYLEADKFAAEWEHGHRFMCVFPKNIHVLSEFVHPANPHENGFIVRCKIPKQFRHLVREGQKTTPLHVNLHAMEDLERNRTGLANLKQFPSVVVTETPAIFDIPVCHPTPNRNFRANQFNLTAFTRIKSHYALSHRQQDANSTVTSPVSRLLEWIDYHRYQGFDHFIIYDNDVEQHGPIEDLLKPYIKLGLVTYRWFPLEDCWTNWGGWEGYLSAEGQLVASLAALHRMGYTTQFFAHMDVDKFFVPLGQTNRTVLDMMLQGDPSVDAFEWRPTLMAPCNGTHLQANESIIEN